MEKKESLRLPTTQELAEQLQGEYPGAIVQRIYPVEPKPEVKIADVKRYHPGKRKRYKIMGGFKNYIWDEAWELNVSRDKVRETSILSSFGTNNDVDGSMETIWDAGDLYTYLTTAATVTVTSTDSDDSETGTGARTVTVEGLDASYNQVSETLTVGGSAGTVEFYRVFRAFVASSGSTGSNEGTISFFEEDLAQIRAVGSPTSRG